MSATGEDAAARLRDLLERIVADFGLDAEVEILEEDDLLTGEVLGADLGRFIGRRGQTIDAVRHLAQRIILRDGASKLRIEVDADGYRDRRADALEDLAEDAAEEALRLGRPVALEPMPASERRIVHECLRDYEGVLTRSEGEEPGRHLVVVPAED